MKLAILVKSCHRDLDRGCHDIIRSTWARDLKMLGVDTFFFVGRDPSQQDTRRTRKYAAGEVVVDSPDDYMGLPIKTRRICQWVTNKMFQHVFLCDVDTLVKGTLVDTGFESFDYAGRFFLAGSYPGCPPFRYKDAYGEYPECRAWASGGIGYYLSRRAADVIADTPPTYWAEDFYVGQALAPALDKGLLLGSAMTMGNGDVTSHFPKTAGTPDYKPEYMKMAYEAGSFENLFKTGKLVA